jgi:hypothetical protein
MNSEFKRRFQFDDVVNYAKDFARIKSPKATRIWNSLANKSIRDYVYLCYVYLRWVDDFVDNPETAINKKKEFIEYQKTLIESLYNPINAETTKIEEASLIYFAEYALLSDNKVLLDEVKNMVEALSMDVYRLESSGVFSNSKLNLYIELMSKSLFNILCVFVFPKSEYREEYFLGMKFTTIALMIRDLEEDIDAGFINIGIEDIKRYNLDLGNLKNDRNLSLWLSDRIKYLFGILYEEAAQIKCLPVKFRIYTYYSLIYRLPWIVRAKVYNYSLKYISGHTLLKEIKTYLITFLLTLKIFIMGFIHSPKDVNRK